MAYRKKTKHRRISTFGRLIKMGLAVAFLGLFGTFVTFVYYATTLPEPEQFFEHGFNESTKIYDRTGTTLLFEFGNERRTFIPYGEIPDIVKTTTIVAEDKDFFRHPGIDIRGILRALWVTLKSRGIEQGGSTITQQLVKNVILTPERSLQRKIREVVLALELERRYSKERILELYLNYIPYGSNIYGIEAAAQNFFSKPARDLTVAEAALLASLPKAPTRLSPFGSRRDELMSRKDWVIDRVSDFGYIRETERAEAKHLELKFSPARVPIKAPHFVMYVREQLESIVGKDSAETSGLKVFTTLDFNLQQAAEETIAKFAQKNESRFKATNTALVALDPKTGDILAMVGSRDYFDIEHDGNVNVVIRPRQPGSAFKPIVYATAFERGFTPNTVILDAVTEFASAGAGSYMPHNYTGQEYGPVTMRQALARSLNVASVKVLYLAGVENALNMAERLGITTLRDRSRFGLSLVLGGAEVKLLELAAAYGVFAREGAYAEPRALLKVDAKTQTIFATPEPQPEERVAPEIARQINSILSDNDARAPVFGLNSNLWISAFPVAAKSGTTQDFHDGWTVGYTPTFVAGVWVGNNDNAPMAKGADGTAVAGPIWNEFMRRAFQGKEKDVPAFIRPQVVTTGKAILDGQFPIEQRVLIDRLSGKRATEFTPVDLIEERVFREAHSILYYVNRDSPRGAPPSNPAQDPQFDRWEQGVLSWVEKRRAEGEIINETLPTETDDLHTATNQPSLEIQSPVGNTTIISGSLEVTVAASAPQGLASIEAFLDEAKLGEIQKEPPQKALFSLPQAKLDGRTHMLRIRALDPYMNAREVSLDLILASSLSETGSLPSPAPSP